MRRAYGIYGDPEIIKPRAGDIVLSERGSKHENGLCYARQAQGDGLVCNGDAKAVCYVLYGKGDFGCAVTVGVGLDYGEEEFIF